MPRDVFKTLSLKEQRFVYHFLREETSAENEELQIRTAERKCRLTMGTGKTYLKRDHVQREIARRRMEVQHEQNVLIAQDQAKLAAEEDKRHVVTLDKIEEALEKVIKLDPEKHGSTVLSAISLGLVYTGTIRTGKTERLLRADPTDAEKLGESATSFYRSIFHGERQNEVPSGATALMPDEAPAPLMPDSPPPRPPVLKTSPPPTKAKTVSKGIEIT